MVNFENIGFSPKIKSAIKKMGYVKATEVQEKAIPLIIAGKNVVSKSFTGSGKTAAFGIGISERILRGHSRAALILCPTRELAVQVKEELEKINRETGFRVSVVYGGRKMSVDEKILQKRIDLLCATPGRLLDHFENRRIDPKAFDTVVLDEADRMLDMGFIQDIKHVLAFVRPKSTHLFSATLVGSVAKLIEKYIPEYEEVMIQQEIVDKDIIQEKQHFSREEKFDRLLEWVKKMGNQRILIFVATKRSADYLDRKLNDRGFKSTTIHGDKSQKAREIALQRFKEGRRNVLIATDVAARGLQIDSVELVVNFDRASDADTHKHRIGRTGRMGEKGLAVTFIPQEDSDKSYWKDLGINYAQGQKARPNYSLNRFGGSQGRSFGSRAGGFGGQRSMGFGGRSGPRSSGFGGRSQGRSFGSRAGGFGERSGSGRSFSRSQGEGFSGQGQDFNPEHSGFHGNAQPKRRRQRRNDDPAEFVYRS